MRYTSIALLPALAAGFLLTAALAPRAQSRYEAPPRAVLSGDLASPWLLQLGNRPTRDGTKSSPAVRQQQTYRERSYYRPAQPQVRSQVRQGHPARVENVSVRSAPRRVQRPSNELDPRFLPQVVQYGGDYSPGTLVISTADRYLYLVMENGEARRYGVGVGKEGFTWSGSHKITRKAEWPGWTPPSEMIVRERKKGRELPAYMEGGPENPLGARALYIGDTLYRIHGTNQPWTIGKAVSSGCIRMRNEDVTDLYERVGVGTRVVVLNG